MAGPKMNVYCKHDKQNLAMDKHSDIVSERKPKRFGIVPEFCLLKTDCFDLVQNLLSCAK
jgi:hypothetical protein